MTNRMHHSERVAWLAKAAEYGAVLGRNGAHHHFNGLTAADAPKVITLARRGELAEAVHADGIAERVTARSLAGDLGVRAGTKLAADMHTAMVAAWGPAFYAGAVEIAETALRAAAPGEDIYA